MTDAVSRTTRHMLSLRVALYNTCSHWSLIWCHIWEMM